MLSVWIDQQHLVRLNIQYQQMELEVPLAGPIGLSFNHGDVEHPVFGKASDIKGVIPFQLDKGKYCPPSLLSDSLKLNEFVQSLAADHRDLWPNDLDEEIERKIHDYVLIAIFFNPKDQIDDPKVRAFISFCIFALAFDDVTDGDESGGEEEKGEHKLRYANMRSYVGFMRDMFGGQYKSVDEMLSPFRAIRKSNEFLLKFVLMAADTIPGWREKNTVFCQDFIAAWTLLMEANFSAGCKTYLGAHICGCIPALELVALVRGLTIRPEIRADILFHKMKEAFGSASHLINDILGFKRDLKMNQIRDSSILSQVMAGFSFKDSFDFALHQLRQDLNDIRQAGVKLREAWAGDADLDEYIACVERALDGQLYFYTQVEIYGNLDLHVVAMCR